MRVGILTWYIGYNIGAVLQAKALQYAVSERILSSASSCETIWYQTKAQDKMYGPYRQLRGVISRDPKVVLHNAYMLPILHKRKQTIDRFIFGNMEISSKYIGKDIYRANEAYDVFICGSDQIWNPEWLDETYLLPFAGPDKVKIAYAPSIGVSHIDSEKEVVYRQNLSSGWRGISVREKSSVSELRRVTGREDVVDVCDPVLLMEKTDWDKCFPGENPRVDGDYIFCYFLGHDKEERDLAKAFAAAKGNLPIINLTHANNFCKEDVGFGEEKLVCSPVEFLNLIRHASYILTDSFHAVAFSILFQKEFYYTERNIVSRGGNVFHFQTVQKAC